MIYLGDTEAEETRTISALTEQAMALSEATGREIIFVHNRDSEGTWGTYGRFAVKR